MEIHVTITGIDEAMAEVGRAVDPLALQRGIAAAAFYVESKAKILAPYDTGFLRNSIYTVTPASSGYASAYLSAKNRNAGAAMLPEVSAPGALSAVISVGAEYGVYQELGTRLMPAHPFMRPALEQSRAMIAEIIRRSIRTNG